ncbi:MAG TPA: integrase, partial [Hellea balneolensis]|nr:integrase [Hellea balneolensis]
MQNIVQEINQNKKRPWNLGKLVGQKSPLTPQQVWAIRVRLQLADHKRDLALFNLALD